MTYTGDVSASGPPHLRELPDLQITKLAVGPMDNNAYLLRATGTGATLLVDAAADADRLLATVPVDLGRVLTTHRHADHWGALAEVVAATRARAVANPRDAQELPVPVAELVDDGDVLELGGVRLEVVALRGHTPGSIALLYDDPAGHPHLFTGDSLFPGGPGATAGPPEFTSLLDDLEARVFDRLPDETWVYPGHGADTTLGAERPHLGEWRERGW